MARRSRWRRFVVRPIFWIAAVVALAVAGLALFLETDLARERVRALVAARASEAIGRPVLIAGAEFELFPFSLVLHDVVVPGDRPLAPAFLKVRRLEVEGDFEGIGARVLELRRVAASGVEVTVERRREGDNVPRLRRRSGGRRLTVHIGGLSVDDARVTVAERTLPLRVEASAVLARFAGLGGTELEGSVTAQEVVAVLPGARPAGFAFSAKARVLEDRVEISNARISSPEVSLRTSGQVRWRDGTAVDLTVAVDGSGAFLDRLGYLEGGIRGPIAAEGTVAWRPEAWGWRARVTSPAVEIFGFAVEGLDGVASGGSRRARFELERGRFASGSLAGTLDLELEGERSRARLEVELERAALDDLLARFGVPVEGFAGRADGRFLYAFVLANAERGDGSGELEVTTERIRGDRVGAVGRIPIRIVDGVLELPDFELTTSGQAVTGFLRYRLAERLGSFSARIRSGDLEELARLLPALEPGAAWTPVSGTGDLLIDGSLAADATRLGIELDLRDVATSVIAVERASGRLALGPDAIDELDLELGRGSARLGVAGRIPFAPDRPELDLELIAEGWPLDDARPWLPFELPVDGPVQGRLRLTGSVERLRGDLIASVEPVSGGGLDARRLDLLLGWDPERLELERGALISEAGSIEARGALGFAAGELDLRLSSDGLDLSRPPLAEAIAGSLGGRLRFDATVAGTLERPEARLEGRLAQLTLGGRLLSEEESSLSLRLDRERLEADASLAGLARVSGGGRWDPAAGSRLDFRVESDWLGRLVEVATGEAVDGLSGGIDGFVALLLTPEGGASARIELPELEFRYAGHRIRSLEPVQVRVDAEGIEIESLFLGLPGSDDELFVSGRLGAGSAEPIDLNVQASLAAEWFEPLVGDLDLGGRVEGLARVGGTLGRPRVNGQAAWSGGRFVPPVVPHTFENLRALALLYPEAVVLDRLDAEIAGGTLAVKGRVDLSRPAEAPGYRFEIAVRDAAPRWPAGWQLRGDADLVFGSSLDGRSLRGEVVLDRAWYLRDLNLSPTQLVQRLLARGRVDVAETDEWLSTTALNVAVRAPGALRVRNNVARLGGDADLVVRGSLARPVLFGEVAVDPGGRVTYSGNEYDVERGRLTFANPARIDPLLDVVARTRVDQYDVTLNLSGSLDRLNTTFSSDPPLPDLDILGLLATGAPVQRAAFSEVAPRTDGTGGAVSAEALLYGQAASLLTARVGRLFGLDRVQVQPLTSGDTISEARVTVGKRLSSRLFVTYSVDPSSTAQQILQVEWRVTGDLVLVLTQNGNESYAVDARWETRF